MDTTRYCEWLLAQGLDPSTVNIYRGKLVRASQIAVERGWDLKHMSASDLGSLAGQFPETSSSLTLLKYSLVHYWAMLGVDGPAKAIRPPARPPARYRGLSDGDAARLEHRAAGDRPGGTAVLLGLYLALRRAEMASLHSSNFNDDLTVVRVVGKGQKTRFLPVHGVLREALGPVLAGGYVFPGKAGREYAHCATVRRWIGDLADDVGLTITNPHALRYTCATRLYEETGDIYLVQEFLGHSDPATTSRYLTRVREERMRSAVEALDYQHAA